MAREASLTMDCNLYTEDLTVIIKAMNDIGWGFADDKMEYLPVGDNDLFNWQSDPLSYEKLFDIISEKQGKGELCGVILYHKESGRGVSLLAENTHEIMLSLNIDRKTVTEEYEGNADFTDFSWYIENIVLKLQHMGCDVFSLNYNEYMG